MKRSSTDVRADVVIVGGGPAGLACAIASARQGLRVEVIDAMRPPIDKACGEGLMPDSLSSLEAIGVDLDGDFRGVETHMLRGIRFLDEPSASGRSSVAEAGFPGGPGLSLGRGIRRGLLHQVLIDCATRLGVRFQWEHSVQGISVGAQGSVVRTNRQSFAGRYVVGADGPQSRIATWCGLSEASVHSRRIGLRQHYRVPPWSDFVEVYWGKQGQAYVTPISSTEVCVAFISRERIRGAGETLARFPGLQRHLAVAEATGRPRGAITLGRKLRRVTCGNVALAGDASGSVDAVTGEGLALCFRQAAALSVALGSGDLGSYQQAHRRMQRMPMLMSRGLLWMDGSPGLRRQVFRAFEQHPGLFDRLLQMHIGQRPAHLFGGEGLLATGLHILAS